jgi:hypothetical protein
MPDRFLNSGEPYLSPNSAPAGMAMGASERRLRRHHDRRGLFEKRCHAVSLINIKTGRLCRP